MARVYLVKYNGQEIWIPESGGCEDADEAAAKVTGCRPGYNCFVSTRFTGDLTAQEYIAQQQAAAPTPTPTPSGTTSSGATTGSTTTGGTTSKYLPPAPIETETPAQPTNAIPGPAQGYNWDEWAEYERYLRVLQTPEGANLPVPKNISDYFTNKKNWERLGLQGRLPTAPRTSEQAFWVEGQLNIAGQILSKDNPFLTPEGEPVEWLTPGGEPAEGAAGEWAAEQQREFLTWRQWASRYGEPGDWYAVDIQDYFNNPDKVQQQLSVWQQRAAEQEAEEEYIKAERYHETPEYYQSFTPWMEEQGQFSGAMAGFVEKESPSLVSRFQSTQPRLTGFPTREEARAEAARREAGFEAWLPGQMPTVEQKYWGQTPLMRGERPYMYQPTLRTVNW